MLNVQDILEALPGILETVLGAGNSISSIFAAAMGGICALRGMKYLKTLQEKKAAATFSFETQLYARLYELKLLLEGNEYLLTNLYSDTARKEWGDQRGAQEAEAVQFYNAVQESLDFIKNAEDQMPAYNGWVSDYAALIQFLVEVLHFDIRDSDNHFKYTEPCSMDERAALCRATCTMLEKLMAGIKEDQTSTTEELFSHTRKRMIVQSGQQPYLLREASAEEQPGEGSDESDKDM